MRGNYFSDTAGIERKVKETNDAEFLTGRSAGHVQETAPTSEPAPSTVESRATVASVVAFLAHRVLLNDLDYHGIAELTTYHPTLAGLTEAQIREAIDEALA
jgi:hypothetical protein